jgi:Fur family transcriptional regulator, ferric uptake regulator
MTISYRSPGVELDTVGDAADALRRRGLRVSAARRLVLEALFAARSPVTAESIAAGLGGRLPLSDLASVYRNLDVLEQQGFVRHLHLGHGAGLYALAGNGDREYVVCERCGRLETLDHPARQRIRVEVRRSSGFEACFDHFPLPGLCPGCAVNGRGRPITGRGIGQPI